MLCEVDISGLGVIDRARAPFSSGLTVVTGETGAGKTMVVTSLHLLSGARADPGRVREGRDKAVVEGRFATDGTDAATVAAVDEVLEATGGARDEDGTVIAVRTVNADGRSRANLGGRSVPAGALAEFTAPLITVHGQNDQLRLQRPDQQRDALDRFGDRTIAGPAKRYRAARTAWLRARNELLDRVARSRELAREADQLRFGLDEIGAVDPNPGEDVELVALIRRLGDLESLRESAARAHEALVGGDAGDEPAAMALLGAARSALGGAEDPALTALEPRISEVIAVVTDIAEELSSYLDGLSADPAVLETHLNRQAQLRTLTRKYAEDVDGVLEWARVANARLSEVDVSSDTLGELEAEVRRLADVAATAAAELSAARTKAAGKLSSAVSAELAGLAMGRSRLEVRVRRRPAVPDDDAPLTVDVELVHAGASGIDDIEFLLQASGSGRALPISRSASGGELSRVMLALEVVLARSNTGTTMVFDEVDAGVGGRAAVEIGRRLARLARTHQVIVVTHLPQVAAYADQHLIVDKTQGKTAAVSGVRLLDDSERVVELARMLAGLDDTETGRAHAEELLATATAERTAST